VIAAEFNGTRISSAREAVLDPSQYSLANTLSGGDRSALAIAFFLAIVELDPNIADTIVIFDDPYHNQDRSRQRCTIEKNHHITDIARQCFVLSHDLEFARAVEKKMRSPKKVFRVPLKTLNINENLPLIPTCRRR